MGPMLKKFKQRLNLKIKLAFQEKQLQFENRNVSLAGQNYFLCRNVISTIPEMVAVEERAHNDEDVWNYNTFQIKMKDQNKTLYFGLRQNDELLGFIGCRFNLQLTRLRIMKLSVLPEHKELASYLLDILLDRAQESGVSSVFVQVRSDQEKEAAFYQEHGFKKLHPEKNAAVSEYQLLLSENKDRKDNE